MRVPSGIAVPPLELGPVQLDLGLERTLFCGLMLSEIRVGVN
jgi:hypothetical protein